MKPSPKGRVLYADATHVKQDTFNHHYEFITEQRVQMSSITYFAQQCISDITQSQEIKPERISLNPLSMDEETVDSAPENWVGAQFVYTTQQKPQTRLQIVFGDSNLKLLDPDSPLGKVSQFATQPRFRTEWLTQFNEHPDPKVKAILLELTTQLESQGFVTYGITWDKEFELMEKEQRDELAGLQGIFFPILHFRHSEVSYDVVVRCEPVVALDLEA